MRLLITAAYLAIGIASVVRPGISYLWQAIAACNTPTCTFAEAVAAAMMPRLEKFISPFLSKAQVASILPGLAAALAPEKPAVMCAWLSAVMLALAVPAASEARDFFGVSRELKCRQIMVGCFGSCRWLLSTVPCWQGW
jgi:hypothetical protein